MSAVQEMVLRLIGICLLVAAGGCVIRGAFGAHKAGNGGNDDINIAGWKSLGSWWALAAVMGLSGAYGTFMRFFNQVFHYVFSH